MPYRRPFNEKNVCVPIPKRFVWNHPSNLKLLHISQTLNYLKWTDRHYKTEISTLRFCFFHYIFTIINYTFIMCKVTNKLKTNCLYTLITSLPVIIIWFYSRDYCFLWWFTISFSNSTFWKSEQIFPNSPWWLLSHFEGI